MKPKTPQHAKQIEKIVGIARRLFAENGVSETSLADIAKACKFRKATLYYYFQTKEAILRKVFEIEVDGNTAVVENIMPGMSLEEALYIFGDGYLKTFNRPETVEFMKIMISEGLKRSMVHKSFLDFLDEKSTMTRMLRIFTQRLDKKLKPEQIQIYAFQFIGSLFNYALQSKLVKVRLPFEVGDEKYLRMLAKVFAQKI